MEHPGGGAAIFRQALTWGEVKERAFGEPPSADARL